MHDLLGLIATINRPRLLVSAARFGAESYDRALHLCRLIGGERPPRFGEAILRLIELESAIEQARVNGAGDYSPARHVAVLSALLGEARLLRAASRLQAVRG
ncbi:hypothetical protein ruthe_00883 [Rubellimicrobium thermophilum DSM 16684]|uniref:Uncharacterized protein n=1 Tax=Rubellimicrobium thermophilum DSM 16684 TaxID=1123069 RepID=S9S7B6_9RHOB|nr:DUF6477 family protein [Rubellimicrobium thermophilum]EPX86075.1 hypothetical protein ruthe_00883 [Rubellimicrobium thermophilum DSM 16684]